MVGVRWRTATMRPGAKPLWWLAQAILRASVSVAGSNEKHHDAEKIAELSVRIQHADRGFGIIRDLINTKANENFLLLVDQFEELFRFETAADEEERRRFVDLLVRFEREPQPGLYVIATMRSEFIGECTRYPGLADVSNRTHFLVPPMTLKGMRQAITRPAKLKGDLLKTGWPRGSCKILPVTKTTCQYCSTLWLGCGSKWKTDLTMRTSGTTVLLRFR